MSRAGRAAGAAVVAMALCFLVIALASPAGAVGIAPRGALNAASDAGPCLPLVGCDPAGRLAGDAAQVAAQGVLDVSARWVAAGATTLLSRVSDVMTRTTSVDLESPHGATNWFGHQFDWMRTLAAFVILPMLLVTAISAIVHQDPARLFRAVAVHLPVALLGAAVAIELTNRALQLTDLLSNQVSASLGSNVQQSLDAVIRAMNDLGGAGASAGGFVLMIGTLLVAFGSLLVWIELLVRASAIDVAVLFLPLALSGLLWPSTARWARRMIELLVALILSKFIIVAVISLAGAALANGDGLDAVLAGAALMLMAAFSPFVLLRLVPIAEAGVIGQLEGLERRPVAAAGGAASRLAGAAAGGSGGGFSSGAAGFSTDASIAPALGAVLPDPAPPISGGQLLGGSDDEHGTDGSAGAVEAGGVEAGGVEAGGAVGSVEPVGLISGRPEASGNDSLAAGRDNER